MRLDRVAAHGRRLPVMTLMLAALGVLLAPGTALAARRVSVAAPRSAARLPARRSHAAARRVVRAYTDAPGNQNVTPGIIPSNDSAGYGWNGSTDPATFSMTFTEPTITCTGASQNSESSVDIGILAESSAGLGQAGQSTIYSQNFCVLYQPVYRFDLSIPGVGYNGYGYGSANPGDSITLTDTIGSAGTSVTYTDNTTGATQTFVGNGGTLQTVQIGLFPIPGSVLAGFNPIAVTGVTLNGAGLGSLPNLGQVNLDQGSTIGVATSSLAADETDFTMSYVNAPGPTVSAAAVTDGSSTEVPNGPATGGTPLTITGTNFGNPGDNVSVTLVPQNGAASVQALDATVVSDTEIQATTADGTGSIGSSSTLPANVEVDVGGVTGAAPQTFTYAKVWVSGVSTDAITLGAPLVPLTITGYGFAGATGLTFELANGKGMHIAGQRLTVAADGTEIHLTSPWLPGLRLWFANGHPESSYLTDVEATAGGATSPANAPDDQVTFRSPSASAS
jgi:IPT/TIG domain